MGTLKTYNQDTKQWEIISTTDASQVDSRSEKLARYVGNDSTNPNVQEVLEKIVDDVNVHKGNISWLALHGGGGSGGGGGQTVATGVIKVNGSIISGGQIVRKDTERLYFSIEQEVTQTWNYVVTFNNRVLRSGTITNNQITIADSANPLVYTGGQGTLSITCSCGLANIYWSGTIIKNQLSLRVNQVSTSIQDIDTTEIIYTYAGTAIGDYTLRVNGIEKQVSISQVNQERTITLKVSEIYTQSSIGSNTTTAVLTKNDDETISTTLTHQVVITSDSIVISSDFLNPLAPIDVPKNSNIPCIFIAYLTGESYMMYKLTLNGVPLSEDWKTSASFGTTVYEYIPTTDPSLVEGHIYNLVIDVKSATGKTAQATYQVHITESASIELARPRPESLLCDFRAYGNSAKAKWNSVVTEYEWEGSALSTVTQSVDEFNSNILSGITTSQSDPTYFRLSNKAYGAMTPWKIGNVNRTFQEILNAKNDFTISLSFRADYHSEDNRTIFQLGQLYSALDPENANELQRGILIRAHSIQVKGASSTCEQELQDKEIYNIDLVYTASNHYLKIYVDGVITKFSKTIGNLDFTGCTPYLGCSYNNGECLDFSDCQFYRIMFYSAALNDYEILINHLQNRSYTNFVDGKPDDTQITEGFNRNFIDLDPASSQITQSWFWNINAKEYSLENFIKSEVSEGRAIATLNPNIDDFTLPIPLLFIDLSSSSQWTWSNFIAPQAVLGEVSNIPFIYYDQSDPQKQKISGVCQIKPQGTSTLNNALKNLLMNLIPSAGANPNIFIPKANWLPESAYTLKADTVDSSHSLNASVGKFINEVLANSEEGSPWFAPRAQTLEDFKETEYYTQCTSEFKPTLKTAVEGFPVFLIIRFYDSNPLVIDVRSLGIYQFILGRDSVHNLGLKILNKVKDASTGASVVPDKVPFYAPNCQFEEANQDAYWIEATETHNVLSTVDLGDKNLDLTNNLGLTALCWQSTNGMLNRQFEVKYGGGSPSNAPHFKDMVESISTAPACLFNYFDVGEMGTLKKSVLKGSTYPALDISGGGYARVGTVQIAQSDDNININEYLDITNAYKYFTVGLLFGLTDNFCKNQPFVLFDAANNSKYRLTFYDMDTGLGGDNNGNISKPSYLFSKGLVNDGNYARECFIKNDSSIIAGVDNKLWLSLEDQNVAAIAGVPTTDNAFSYFWCDFRNTIAQKYQGEYKDLTEFFVKKYFIPQTEGCGELLFNLTYQRKYIETPQQAYLAGRRIQQVTQWLREHIDFLDSISSWKATTNTLVAFDKNETEALRVYSKDPYTTIPLKYNKSLLIKTTDQGGNYIYPAFCQKNVYTEVRYGGGTQSTDALQKSISWNNSLLEIGNSTKPFGSSGFQNIDSNTLYGFNTLDLSNCTTISSIRGNSPINFQNTFLNGAEGSELRIINLENARNSANIPNIDLNLTGFTKLTDINIKNSSVVSITLPTTPLVTLEIAGSSLSALNLSQQNLLEEIDVTGCTRLESININGCERAAQVVGLSSLNNLRTVSIADCAFEDLTIDHCNALTSVQIVQHSLKNITIDNCENLTSVNLAQCDGLEEIVITNCPNLTNIILEGSGTWFSGVTKIDFTNTKITKIVYGTQGTDSYLDLSRFTGLNEFNIRANSSVAIIKFANQQDRAIPITHRFTGCTNLARLYGHIVVTNDTSLGGSGTFSGCSNFTIHGNSFHGNPITASGKYRTPWGLLGYVTPPPIEELRVAMFDNGATATNMDFAGTNSTYMFSGTNCTQFDVYYFLCNKGTISNLSYTFRSLRNTLFNWTSSVDNSPNKYMFYYCGNVTSMTMPFYGSCGYYRIVSPTRNASGAITADDGLFSPLTSLTSLNWEADGTYISDNYVFRRLSGSYALTSIDYFYPRLLVKNVNAITEYLDVNDTTSLINYLMTDNNYKYCGNLTKFFENTPNVSSITAFMSGTMYINYDASYDSTLNIENFKFPTGVVELYSALRSAYATGRIRFTSYFNQGSALQRLYHSFSVGSSLSSLTGGLVQDASVTLDNNTFSQFGAQLTHIGYKDSGDFSGNARSACFSGAINKTIGLTGDNQFPYDMFSSNTNLEMCAGLFAEGVCSRDVTVELPGRLFANNRNLKNVSALFYNFKNRYTLKGNGFANCPQLENVSYAFAQAEDRMTFYLQGHIPAKLFYHGASSVSKTIYGTNTDPVGGEYPTAQPATVNYTEVKATIKDMSYCFQRCNLDYFVNTTPTIENNPDYAPWKYVYSGGVWSEASDYGNKQQTFIWDYDGVNLPASYTNYEFLDEEHSNNTVQITGPNGSPMAGTLYFCCPPDLFRYCTDNANIRGMFYCSGVRGHSTNYGEAVEYNHFGIKGRICPYLLKPVKNITDISHMFERCKLISSYQDVSGSSTYKIPKTFFSYAPKIRTLAYTFSCMMFEGTVDLGVFSVLDNLDINHIFALPYFSGNATIQGIFSTKTITNLDHCFAVVSTYANPQTESNDYIRSQNITFNNIFTSNKVTKALNGSVYTDGFAFTGYSNSTIHIGTKTLDQAAAKFNYANSGGTPYTN